VPGKTVRCASSEDRAAALAGAKGERRVHSSLCRTHHRELHRPGHEGNWWANLQIAPILVARELWEASPVHGTDGRQPVGPRPHFEQK